MNWILIVWISVYASYGQRNGNMLTIQFKTEADCEAAGKKVQVDLWKGNGDSIRYSCIKQ